MAPRRFSFDEPDRFVAGVVGEPGSRAFFLQARKGGALVSVGIEKSQVGALATRMLELLEMVGGEAPADVPIDAGGLEEPVVEVFRVGSLALSWDEGASLVTVAAQSGSAPEMDASEEQDLLEVRLRVGAVLAFAHRAEELILAGRPTCPFCGQPLEPGGHFCPRSNGHLH